MHFSVCVQDLLFAFLTFLSIEMISIGLGSCFVLS